MTRPILVCLNLVPFGEQKLPHVETYARALQTRVLLLHVLAPRAVDPETVLPGEAMARAYLETIAARLNVDGVRTDTVVRAGPVAETILDEAAREDAQLIILGANVRPQLATALVGSVADQVARGASCPVLLVREVPNHTTAAPVRSFMEDASHVGPTVARSLGARTVEVGRIIGSVDRAQELGSDFRPRARRRGDNERYERIARALDRGESLPPVELYKLGFGYYVLDGHHRVAAALAANQLEIDAVVTEYLPVGDERAARTFAERRAFERSTGLTSVGAVRPETYEALASEIAAYRAALGDVDYRDAARRWEARVFRPLWKRVRAARLSQYFPGERSADIIARIASWRREQARQDCGHLDWDEAFDGFCSEEVGLGQLPRAARQPTVAGA